MFQAPRGTQDVLPEMQPYWQAVLEQAREVAGFREMQLHVVVKPMRAADLADDQLAAVLVIRADHLADLDAGMLMLAGGKAANLGELIHRGLPVPDGFCVTTAAYDLASRGSALGDSSGTRGAWLCRLPDT